ncbi:Uncharacterized protein FKW44_022291 [Caligus rogercresseyi]|uniref:Uncharacterized protein n=1 Tax=Caligus rogercresseyi TaxID=217165 RepID=A0A7T8GT43_CALRO|nr:Uncharacterized protein FKW44_022291 [Caligus rogercresseyi]
MEAKRHEVAVLIRAGHGTNDIVTLTNVCRRSVSNVPQAHQNGQDLKDKPRCGRPVKLSTKVVQKAFTANPKLAMATLARKKNVNKSTVSRPSRTREASPSGL